MVSWRHLHSFSGISASILSKQYKNLYTGFSFCKKLGVMASPDLNTVPKVDIDPEGVFKYILLNVHSPNDDGASITILRGYKRCNYHSDIYDEVQEKLKPLDCEPLGGGRISHEPKEKKMHFYGYSQGYGKADHEVAAKLAKDAYPGYTITISDEGY